MSSNSIISALDDSFEKYGDSIAVSQNGKSYSYKQLNEFSVFIAKIIKQTIQELKLEKKNDLITIGLYFEHSIEIVPAIIGVLRSASIYVPLEKNYPNERLKQIIHDVNIPIILTSSSCFKNLSELVRDTDIRIIDIQKMNFDSSEFKQPNINPDELAYILFTSGSTGTPKGVIQNHKNILHFCTLFGDMLRITKEDKLLLTTSFGHTVSVIDLFSLLLKGGEICIQDVTNKEVLVSLNKIIANNKITIFHSIPNVFRLTFSNENDSGFFKSIRLVILGGENVGMKDFELFKNNLPDRSVFVNLYGSSELIIGLANLMNKKTNISRVRIPIGVSLKGVDLKLIGEDNEDASVFSIGELCFFSEFLSPGYWESGKNIRDYISNSSEIKKYVSGDLGRYLPNGLIEFMGRNDTQIKINGFRIELQEIEISIDSYRGISKSIVKLIERENGDKNIVCFYKRDDENLEIDKVIEFLKDRLPQYMIPRNFIEMEEFPLNANGKIDRGKLDIVNIEKQNNEYISPKTDVEKKLVEICLKELSIEKMSISDNYFELGMDSLKLSNIYLIINGLYPGAISVQDMFDNKTIQHIAYLIENKRTRDNGESEPKPKLESFEF